MVHLVEIGVLLSVLAIFYHHVGYPLLLGYFSAKKSQAKPVASEELNQFVVLIPMFNEAVFIGQKIDNLARLDYPFDKFEVLLLDDGSIDKTVQVAHVAAKKHPQLNITIKSNPLNQGKVALFNEHIQGIPDDRIIFFSDVSAMISKNCLRRANSYFNNHKIGAFCPKYIQKKQALAGEQLYWKYLDGIRTKESKLGTPIGFSGAGYAIRKKLWAPIPGNTINDDFVIPMKIIEKGGIGVYDNEAMVTEIELSSQHLDWNRRTRISQGNIQQVLFLSRLMLPRYGYVAWMFFSGKVLRITMPWFFLMLLLGSFYLSFYSPFVFIPIFSMQILIYFLVVVDNMFKTKKLNVLSYFVNGHLASLIGWRLGLLKSNGRWQRANATPKSYMIHPVARYGKWIVDKLSAFLGLGLFILLLPFIALLIKLTSPGPVFYKQLRVGRGGAKSTKLFYLYKFRTMNICSEQSDITWTAPGDPRIFPFGSFLRRTHLDELPQFYNILKGEMSLIGPRPERPSLYSYIEKNIPFYEERLYGLLPGLTGLAQVTFPPDKTIDDVRKKVAYDHAYAIHLSKPWLWIKIELVIVFKTIHNVLMGKGQ